MINYLKPYITIGSKFDIDYVFSHIVDTTYKKCSKVKFIVENEKFIVKMNSKRYFKFKENINCATCNTPGSYFLLQKPKNNSSGNTAHFNLYAEDIFNLNDGQIILMTVDHIIPISKGGSDHRDNLVTMCSICNNKKGNRLPNEKDLPQLHCSKTQKL